MQWHLFHSILRYQKNVLYTSLPQYYNVAEGAQNTKKICIFTQFLVDFSFFFSTFAHNKNIVQWYKQLPFRHNKPEEFKERKRCLFQRQDKCL